jgi:hypothetical protein
MITYTNKINQFSFKQSREDYSLQTTIQFNADAHTNKKPHEYEDVLNRINDFGLVESFIPYI